MTLKLNLVTTFLFLLLFAFTGCKDEPVLPIDPEPADMIIRGVDISFLPEIREHNIVFTDQNGIESELTTILKKSGVNTIRLRLWHTPADGHCNLQEVSTFAKELKTSGFKIFLTIHYSDTWADPGNQKKPAAWESLSEQVLGDSVYAYTKKVVAIINPDIIEIGNEISNGFLWPQGKISNQTGFIALLRKGIQGARDATSDKRDILIHCATLTVADWFYKILKSNNIDYDIIGMSYYPFWTKITPADAVSQLDALGKSFGKKAMFAETAYPFTLDWKDFTNNVIGMENQLLSGYPASNEGQKRILTELRLAIEKSTHGYGFCYWAPEWVAFKGNLSTTGSSWENNALFDFNNKALPALDVFKK